MSGIEQALLQMGFSGSQIKRIMLERPGHDAEFYANELLSSSGSSTPPLVSHAHSATPPPAGTPVAAPRSYASALSGHGSLYAAALPREGNITPSLSSNSLAPPTPSPSPAPSAAAVPASPSSSSVAPYIGTGLSPRVPATAPAAPATQVASTPPAAISMSVSSPVKIPQVPSSQPLGPLPATPCSAALPDSNRSATVAPPAEDNDLLKAIENSLADQGGKLEAREPADPTERMRVEGLPVGLRNAGNTCYFNSLVHIYNCLQPFRNGLLLAPHPAVPLTPQEGFVAELQRLFALLLHSRRKYVNPAPVIKQLLENSGQKNMRLGNQEDPTEFNMLFLDTVKKGLLSIVHSQADRIQTIKQLFRLFRGVQVTEIAAREKDGSIDMQRRPEKFKQLIVALRAGASHQSLYHSLDEYTAPTDIENYTTEKGNVTLASRHVSIESPPAVLTVQIQRASYDRATNQSSKLNTPFYYPKVLSLDRYLEVNKSDTLSRRIRVKELETFVQRCDAQLNALRFREGAGGVADPVPFDTHLASVVAHFDARHKAATTVGEKYELNVVLARLRMELASIRATIRALEHEREQRRAQIDSIFDGPSKHSYTLHAVLVHDGREAKSGHYWAFLHDRAANRWLKYNDTLVTVVDEETMYRESTGGPQQNSSAYCLVYVSDSLPVAMNPPELAPSLTSYVEKDNGAFDEEIRRWREARAGAAVGAGSAAGAASDGDPIASLVNEFRRRMSERLDRTLNEMVEGDEARLRSMAHYLLSMNIAGIDELVQYQLSKEVLEEMFPRKPLVDHRNTVFYQRMQREYKNELPWEMSMHAATDFRHYREEYHALLAVMEFYISGIELALQDKWIETLAFALHAKQRLHQLALLHSGLSSRHRMLENEVLEFARIALLHVSAVLINQVERGGYEAVSEGIKLADVAVEALGADCVMVLLRKDWERVLDLLKKRFNESRDPAIDTHSVERIIGTYRARSSLHQKRLQEPSALQSTDALYLRYRRCKKESQGKWAATRKRIADESSGFLRSYIS